MKLSHGRVREAEQVRRVWRVIPDHGTVLDEMLAPQYWANEARSMTIGDVIEVLAEDGAFFATLLVVDKSSNWVVTKLVSNVDLTAAAVAAPIPDGFYVKWGNPHTKYRVYRESDKQVVKDMFQTETAANAWLEDYKRSISIKA